MRSTACCAGRVDLKVSPQPGPWACCGPLSRSGSTGGKPITDKAFRVAQMVVTAAMPRPKEADFAEQAPQAEIQRFTQWGQLTWINAHMR